MENIIVGIVTISAGLYCILNRKKFSREIVADQNKYFGFHFGEKEIKRGYRFLPIFGVLLIILGILILIGIFKFK